MKNYRHKNHMRNKKTSRTSAGKSSLRHLPMIVTFLMLIVGGAILFLKSNQLQGSAVDEAALAAARAMSEVVVNTPECGFVSLSDQPSDGKGTECGDRFASPVRSINTIIGTARLDLIIADKLHQSLMEEFAQKDLKKALEAKEALVEVLEKSMQPGSLAYDKDGKQVSVYQSAIDAYQKSSNGNAEKKNVSLRLSLGSLESGLPTTVPLPQPLFSAPVDLAMNDGKVYKSFVNIPYKGKDFVFGGIGTTVCLVDSKNWRAKIEKLPYQIPTIVKVAVIKKNENKDIEQVLTVACAQPASQVVATADPGALTISFPDGPVPEIAHPKDCYMNEKLNNRESDAMNLLTADGGDYPSDSGSVMKSMNWPLTDSNNAVTTADVWRQALYDWIRSAGPTANIDSVVNMQKITLDVPRPAKIMWNAPLSIGAGYTAIAPISAGIVHIFEFDQDGVVVYRSKIQAPYPLDTVSHNQLYGENFGSLDHSEIGSQEVTVATSPVPKKITLIAAWDVFIRDHVRVRGTMAGGKHAGQPIAKPILAANENTLNRLSVLEEQLSIDLVSDQEEQVDFKKGRKKSFGKGRVGVLGAADAGCPPLIAPQSDFGQTISPGSPFVRPMPFGSGTRPLIKASAVDIRFRREVDVSQLTGAPTTGYFGITHADE